MNATYTLTEGNDALNRVLLMMRYDLGKTLSENVILEQVYTKTNDGNYELKVGPWKGIDAGKIFPNLKQNEYPKKIDSFYSPIGGIPDDSFADFNRFRPSISPEPYKYTEFGYPKSNAYYPRWKKEWQQKHPNEKFGQHQQQTMDQYGNVNTITADEYGNEVRDIKKLTFDEFMEEYRENLFSIGGMAIEAFLTATEFGAIPVTAAWGFLLWYDVNKGIETGNWDWANLIIDVLMVSSAGLLGFELKALVSSEKLVGKGLTDGVETLIKSNEGRNIIKELETLPTKSSSIKEGMRAGLKWFSESTAGKGLNWLGKAAIWLFKKAAQGIGYVLTKIGVLIDKMSIIIEKQLNKIGVTGKLGKGLGAAGGITAFNLSIKAIEEIHKKWVQMGKDAQLEKDVMKYIIVDNQNIYGKDIYYDYKGFKMKKSPNGVFYFYDDKEWVINDETSYNDNQAKLENYYMFRTDLKFNQFKILDKNKKIYEINNKKYQAPKDGWKLKEIK
jgi:hypothetical protein